MATELSLAEAMIPSVGRILRLVFQRPASEPAEEPPPSGGPPAQPEVEFSAYGEDCRVYGRIQLAAERLSDMLNTHDQVLLVSVLVESLADGCTYAVDEVKIARDELLVVEALGPRGNPGRRTRTRPYPLAVKLGPYEVRGYVHVTPGADVLNAVRRRRPMVPLTDASISYVCGGALRRRHAATLLFNRECADWLALTDDEAIDFPELPFPVSAGPLVKDFTGQVLTFQDA